MPQKYQVAPELETGYYEEFPAFKTKIKNIYEGVSSNWYFKQCESVSSTWQFKLVLAFAKFAYKYINTWLSFMAAWEVMDHCEGVCPSLYCFRADSYVSGIHALDSCESCFLLTDYTETKDEKGMRYADKDTQNLIFVSDCWQGELRHSLFAADGCNIYCSYLFVVWYFTFIRSIGISLGAVIEYSTGRPAYLVHRFNDLLTLVVFAFGASILCEKVESIVYLSLGDLILSWIIDFYFYCTDKSPDKKIRDFFLKF
jgi:hypothetical protein